MVMAGRPNPIEEMLGISGPAAGGAPGPGAGMDQMLGFDGPTGGQSPEMSAASSLMTGGISPVPAAPAVGDEAQVGGPLSPMSDPVPSQNPPVSPAGSGAPTPNANDPKSPGNADMVKDFWSRHGRAPTTMDIQVAHAIPALERALGRAPMRIEVLQMLGARQETPLPSKPQFEADIGPAGASPADPASMILGDAPAPSAPVAPPSPIAPPLPPGGGMI